MQHVLLLMQLDDVRGRGWGPNSLKTLRKQKFRKNPRRAEAAAAEPEPEPPNRRTTAMSHVDVKNLKPSRFEEQHFDEYEYYNLTDKYVGEEPRQPPSPHRLRFGLRV